MDEEVGKYLTPSAILDNVFQLFGWIISYLNTEKIDYAIIQGTLLGWDKYKSILPWEVDVDIMIICDMEDFRKKSSFQDLLKRHQLHVRKLPNQTILRLCQKLNREDKCELPTCDLAFYRIENEKSCLLSMCGKRVSNNRWLIDNINKKHIYPLRKSHMHGLTVYVPNNTKYILKTIYGNYENKILIYGFYNKEKQCWKWNSFLELYAKRDPKLYHSFESLAKQLAQRRL
jgi:hypothetical protein